jgi:hypothetical protein
MTRRTLPLVLVLLALVGCQGNDGGQAAPATTTTVAPTTTTRPDPAEEGCRTFRDDPGRAHELLLISRDERIVEAAKLLENRNYRGRLGKWPQRFRKLFGLARLPGIYRKGSPLGDFAVCGGSYAAGRMV